MVRLKTNKKGQAAIEFLMTYGWMLLVVLIVGALIFSFVDFGSLLPNKVDLNNNLKADPTGSIAYASGYSSVDERNKVKIVIRHNGASRVTINVTGSKIFLEAGSGNCSSLSIKNMDTTKAETYSGDVAFLTGHTGIISFNCTGVNGGEGLLKGDSIVGTLVIPVKNPKTDLEVPSTGPLRLQISG